MTRAQTLAKTKAILDPQPEAPTFLIPRTVGHLTLDELLNALIKESGAAEGKALRDEIARRVK